MRKRIIAGAFAGAMLAAVAVPLVGGGGAASAHQRCVDNNTVVQVIANGQEEGDPAAYSTNPQGHDRGIRNARDHSPAIESCPE